jgi:hypothetical protein
VEELHGSNMKRTTERKSTSDERNKERTCSAIVADPPMSENAMQWELDRQGSELGLSPQLFLSFSLHTADC